MVYTAQHAIDEAAYKLSRGKRYAGGMAARLFLRLMTAAGAAAAGMSGAGGVFYASGLLGVGTGIGLQAYLNQKDYEHNKQQLTGMYRKEIATLFGKDPLAVTVDDLENLATQNPSVQQQLDREKNKRNVRTGVWLAAGVAGFAVAAAVAAAGSIGLVAGLTGFVAFQIARPIARVAGEQIYKLNEPTTVELVKSLEWQRTKDKQLTHTQVLEAYISAHPQLGEVIEKGFGAPLAQLSPVDRQRAMLQFGDQIKLDEVTTAINENRMNARELVFAVHGQSSGAYADTSYREHWDNGVARAKDRARTVQNNVKQAGTRAFNNVKQFVSSEKKADEPEAESTQWREYENGRQAARGNGVTENRR